MKGWRVLLWLAGVWVLWGCTAPETPPPATPSPTPPPLLRVFRVPEARALDPTVRACAREQDVLLRLETLSYPPTGPLEGLWLTWGPEPRHPEVPSYALAWWSLRPVVHRDAGVEQVTVETLQAIYRGNLRSWADVGGEEVPLMPLLPPPGHPLYAGLARRVRPYPWAGDVLWVTTPEEMLRWAQTHPGALGWLPEPWWDEARTFGLQILTVEGDPDDLLGPWPVLLQWAPEARVPAAFLGCLRMRAATSWFQEATP